MSLAALRMTLWFVVCFVGFAAAQNSGVKIQGSQQSTNGVPTTQLGGTIYGPRDRLSVDALRSGDYHSEKAEYGRQLFSNADGTRSLNGHAGHQRDNMGGRVNNFGLTYQAPKDAVSWNRQQSGSAHQDTFRYDRQFWSAPGGQGSIGGYVEHTRNNFGGRPNTAGGISGRFNFR